MITRRRAGLALCSGVVVVGLALLSSSPTYASGDLCSPDMALDLGALSECGNVPVLSPGNDTRVNLVLLLLDRDGLPAASTPVPTPVLTWREFAASVSSAKATDAAGFEDGEGSRCRSNDAGAAAFAAIVNATSGVLPEERTSFLAARDSLKANCESHGDASGDATDPAAGARTDAGRAFGLYLRGALAFYGGRFDDAAKAFETLRTNANPWLADTADYMLARNQLNRMQVGAFTNYGTFAGSEKIDQQAALRVEASFETYLKDHPDGRYAASARGLLRRVDWLAGWTEKAAAAYTALLAKPAASRGIDDVALAAEIDSKLLPRLTAQMTKDSLLLAVLDLKAMRKPAGKTAEPTITQADIAGQRDAFASAMPLHDFLMASAAFFIDGATPPVLKGLPDDTRRRDGDHLWFSRQVLRGEALEAAGDRNAKEFWKELYPGTTRPLDQAVVQLALALHDETHGHVEDIFAAGSVVTNPRMRLTMLEKIAGPTLLRAEAHDIAVSALERHVALFTLLTKELTHERYADFLADAGGVSDEAAPTDVAGAYPAARAPQLEIFSHGDVVGEIGCPALSTTVSRLVRDPESPRDRLCLAEFLRLNDLDEDRLAAVPPKGALGTSPSLFPGKPLVRSAIYRAIIANRAAPAADRAFALYRAVNCYATSSINHCGGEDAPKTERKAWYTALKRDYPASHWAKSLTYYW